MAGTTASNVTPELRVTILKMRDSGMGNVQIARDLKIGYAKVQRVVREAGFSAAHVEGTRSRQELMKIRRQKLEDRMIERAEALLDRLDAAEDAGFKTVLRRRGGAEGEATLDFVPSADERALVAALSQLTTTADKLATERSTEAKGISLLESLAGAMGLVDGNDGRDDSGEDVEELEIDG